MSKAPSGKGISAAVRGAVREWMTDTTVKRLYKESSIAMSEGTFAMKIRTADEWVRSNRLKGYRGFIRNYYSKSFKDRSVTLEVKSNEDDSLIEYVTIKIKGKAIGGGKVKVPSVFSSQRGRVAEIEESETFKPFTEAELDIVRAELEFGSRKHIHYS